MSRFLQYVPQRKAYSKILSMLKCREQQHINRRRRIISGHCFRLVWTSGWCHSLFILNVVGNILISTYLLILGRNPYAQVPHFSKVKVNTRLINDKDWWQRHFCSYWKKKKATSHKYLILQWIKICDGVSYFSLCFLWFEVASTVVATGLHTAFGPGVKATLTAYFCDSKKQLRITV